ncbi:MAG TPA: lytic transglycosylase domain-containing protein [Thermoanaerobaculia bacterium]|nr:lytic transglycosylase domain-containing protein [Thermoanaerobaculia bacterium]
MSTSRPSPGPSALAAAALVLVLGVVAPARAELAVLVNGSVLRVDSYELRDGDRLRFGLRSGGFVTLGVERVERIVDDEIVPEPTPVAIETPAPFALDFAARHGVPQSPFGEVLFEAGRRHALNPQLLAAMARAESAYDAAALSRKGARGLMQVMPATAERFGVRADELWDPARNAEAGARYLRFLVDRFGGDLSRVLAAYNAGEGAVDRYGGVPPYRETRGYVARVLRYLGLQPDPTS